MPLTVPVADAYRPQVQIMTLPDTNARLPIHIMRCTANTILEWLRLRVRRSAVHVAGLLFVRTRARPGSWARGEQSQDLTNVDTPSLVGWYNGRQRPQGGHSRAAAPPGFGRTARDEERKYAWRSFGLGLPWLGTWLFRIRGGAQVEARERGGRERCFGTLVYGL